MRNLSVTLPSLSQSNVCVEWLETRGDGRWSLTFVAVDVWRDSLFFGAFARPEMLPLPFLKILWKGLSLHLFLKPGKHTEGGGGGEGNLHSKGAELSSSMQQRMSSQDLPASLEI